MAQDFEGNGGQISSSVELIQGASKVVIMSGDVVKAQSSTADSCDFWLSVVDTISS